MLQGSLSVGRFDLLFIGAAFETEDLVWVDDGRLIVGQVFVRGHLVGIVVLNEEDGWDARAVCKWLITEYKRPTTYVASGTRRRDGADGEVSGPSAK